MRTNMNEHEMMKKIEHFTLTVLCTFNICIQTHHLHHNLSLSSTRMTKIISFTQNQTLFFVNYFLADLCLIAIKTDPKTIKAVCKYDFCSINNSIFIWIDFVQFQ